MENADDTRTPAQATEYDLHDSVGWLMRSSLNLLRQEVEQRMGPVGLTNAQWLPMLKLFTGEADTVAELARGCMQDAGGMTRMLDRLEAKGWCRRQRSLEDRRVVRIVLTDAGREVANTIPAVLHGASDHALSAFSPEETKQFKDYLRRMLLTLQSGVRDDARD